MAQDVRMYWIEDDIKKIQTKTNLYITQYGPEGAFHLAREVVQNGVDECEDEESPGKYVICSYDKQTDILTVEDDGRGFPETNYPLDIFCTKIQSGSKFFRDQSGNTSGEFGLGLTACNALSELFIITSFRKAEKTKHTLEFREGEKIRDEKETLRKGDKQHGTIVKFKPSKKYLGSNTVLPYKEIEDWIRLLMYQMRETSKFTVEFTVYDGLTLVSRNVYKPKPFAELLEELKVDSSYSHTFAIHGCNENAFEEELKIVDPETMEINTKTVSRYIDISVALRYIRKDETTYLSFCNYTATTEGGVHHETVESCFCRYMVNKVKETMSDIQKEKLKILWEDVKNGLFCIINFSTDAQVGFVGNAKQKVGNKDLVPYISAIVSSKIDEFFKQNPTILQDFIKIIKLNAKARTEAQKVKTATQTERLNSFKEHEMKNYVRCNNKGKEPKEIFMVEGDSSSGSCLNACDRNTQAFFMFRGNTLNPLNCTLSDIMANKEWRDYVTLLRCGIGKNCDPSKLYFDRINILTDSDIDGYGISSGMLLFHFIYLRPLIEEGKVYKVFAPLYKLDDKNNDFVVRKAEITEISHKKIQKNYKIFNVDKTQMSKEDVFEFLSDTYDYRQNLIDAAKNSGKIDQYFIEMITAFLTMTKKLKSDKSADENLTNVYEALSKQKYITELMSRIQKKFPEMKYIGDGKFRGAVDSRMCSLKISKPFIRRIEDLIPIYERYGYQKIVVEKKSGKEQQMTIAEFLEKCKSLSAKILARYKGLGQLNDDDMWKTTLDINNRVSIQYTIEDAERDMNIFRKLHGGTIADRKERKEMMKRYKIKREDLDN